MKIRIETPAFEESITCLYLKDPSGLPVVLYQGDL